MHLHVHAPHMTSRAPRLGRGHMHANACLAQRKQVHGKHAALRSSMTTTTTTTMTTTTPGTFTMLLETIIALGVCSKGQHNACVRRRSRLGLITRASACAPGPLQLVRRQKSVAVAGVPLHIPRGSTGPSLEPCGGPSALCLHARVIPVPELDDRGICLLWLPGYMQRPKHQRRCCCTDGFNCIKTKGTLSSPASWYL
ncbi:hypothetical protein K437DRAFT_13322 [Tilletiaria anomala UBC 951]|uniref:Uncharacterized protein n=1 Tax=Tilletiaria anomala (strain ATCC 24038 / CBS 436.72 / UBC 951) TaxID=1037660 RepID=A0A066VCQ2_TILAU|nr:uncharacterized protein K437DRAFT_13322 [Tilletiaria anomala UBC 951]KDN39241.1 hypothetical protein K437DRAFT_13322 [Tilletiaria anomala UBC 951]